jgi:hypothetical protein
MSHLVQRGDNAVWEPANYQCSFLMDVIEDPPNPRCAGLARHYLTLAHNPSVAVVVDDAHVKSYNTTDDSALQNGICEVRGCGSSTKSTASLCSEHHKEWRNSGTRKAGQRAKSLVAETYRQWLLDVGQLNYCIRTASTSRRCNCRRRP